MNPHATATVELDPQGMSPAAYLALFGHPKPSTLAIAIAAALNSET